MPKISAIMALYNTPFKYLKKTVESILNQSFEDFELIVVDDFSTIEYKTFFDNLKNEKIKYIKLDKNIGPGGARNYGIKLAQGKYIAICDSDDIYEKDRFKVQCDFLDNNPDISLVSSAFIQSNNKNKSHVVENNEEIKIELLFNSVLANAIAMFRRQTFSDKNLFYIENKKFGEDYELWVKAMFAGIKMANLPFVLMTYIRRKGQLSKEKQVIQIAALKEIHEKIRQNLGLDLTLEELDIQYMINSKSYKNLSVDSVENWFEQILKTNFYDKTLLMKKKKLILSDLEKEKNRLYKIKIGKKNYCLSKDFKFYIESRI